MVPASTSSVDSESALLPVSDTVPLCVLFEESDVVSLPPPQAVMPIHIAATSITEINFFFIRLLLFIIVGSVRLPAGVALPGCLIVFYIHFE
jgi:hypothetical protein